MTHDPLTLQIIIPENVEAEVQAIVACTYVLESFLTDMDASERVLRYLNSRVEATR